VTGIRGHEGGALVEARHAADPHPRGPRCGYPLERTVREHMKRAVLFGGAVMLGCANPEPPEDDGGARINLIEVATLGTSLDEVSPHPVARVSVQFTQTDTVYWASPTYEPGVLHGYGAGGAVESRLGGPGEGPGELGGLGPTLIQWVGSRAYVASGQSPRLTVFDTDADTVGTENLPWPLVGMAATPGGDLVLAPWSPDPNPVVRRSSGRLHGVATEAGSSEWLQGAVTVGRADPPHAAWVANAWTGHVYAVDEELNARLRWSLELPDSADVDRSAAVMGLAESDGVLWVWVSRRLAEIPSGAAFGPAMFDSIFDTRILALDPATGAKLATYDDTRWLAPAHSERGVFTVDNFETELGDTRIGVYRPTLERGGAG